MDTPKLIESLAQLLWPLIIILLVVVFRTAIAALIETAKSRKFTVKFGGQELTMDEASKQQSEQAKSISLELDELRKRVDALAPVVPRVAATPPAPASALRTILWVDDHPKNNALFAEQMRTSGVDVDYALSTAEGLTKFARRRYSAVITDLGRTEDRRFAPNAGLELVAELRKTDEKTPVFLFSGSRRLAEVEKEALRMGATGVTGSPSGLFGLLGLNRGGSTAKQQ